MGELLDYYKNGMQYFRDGNLNKAFDYLNIAVTGGIEAEEINNVMALILMYRGEFEEAYKFFIINNKKFNNKISEKYLLAIDEINNYIKSHNEAVDLLKQHRCNDALNILLTIRKSGFKTINDDILICLIYYIKREYNKCKKILAEIYNVNKDEIFYYELKSYLDKKNSFRLKLAIASIAAMAIMFSSITISKTYKNEQYSLSSIDVAAKPISSVDTSESQYKVLARLTDDIMKENLYDFAQNDKKIDISKLDDQSKKMYYNLKESYSNKAEIYFYKIGLDLYRNGSYNKAYEYLSIAYNNMKGSYLDEHVIFFVAKAAKVTGNNALDYYREYVKKYPKGAYIEESLYDLSILAYANKDIKESQKYASVLAYEYTNSIYYNDRIKYIMDKD
ncbi:hypothetical protein I6U48_26755 [Clostridium sp. PL3]|uniref:Tetratricopeptide repeat protein n=1 Tax=Clostridium thailandense TaxID=2794346 RepID=A0A949U322_9CLOT|nr:hypothetical protein [Clostridium thailandense]MBV7276481.1 hypothetical protein [Clostridium thailandense]